MERTIKLPLSVEVWRQPGVNASWSWVVRDADGVAVGTQHGLRSRRVAVCRSNWFMDCVMTVCSTEPQVGKRRIPRGVGVARTRPGTCHAVLKAGDTCTQPPGKGFLTCRNHRAWEERARALYADSNKGR